MGSSYDSDEGSELPDDMFMIYAYNKLLESNNAENDIMMQQLNSIRRDLSSNTQISTDKVQEFIRFMEKRKEKKRMEKLFKDILHKKGLDKLTGKKVKSLEKSLKTCKSKCTKATKQIKRK
ncbi:hypothetical protein TRFO_01722 [Tritrichomonas foetus]|uniref:Uncharacterized protein n=1 Tax=Tritrichomonas foetus TaxID=1144522 RepID=A0A1J4JPQ0_9EUKA|nr:hypothetical protein TRFO_01722 [Tritrichomonas foetus]|eukprot:OHT01127.1 hypothetical protein TRFO_01722 [Tritrichomonas foetus]